MRVLVVANWDMVRVPTAWVERRIAALRALGLEVDVLMEECVADRLGFFRLAWRLHQQLRRERYDLVAPLYGSLVGLLCSLQRQTSCALSFAGSDLNGLRHATGKRILRTQLSRLASQFAAVWAAGVSVRTRAMRDSLWWPFARRRAWVIGSGVDLGSFRPQDRSEARRRRGLPVDGRRVAFVASDATERPWKRLDLAKEVVARLPGVALDVLSRVPAAEMPTAYAAADALLVTSLEEGSPNCVKEALACGIPVISVDVGDVREVIGTLTNCAVVSAAPEALAKALVTAIADGRGCPEGPARMAAHYSLSAMASRFLEFYAQTLTSKRSASCDPIGEDSGERRALSGE